LAQHHFQLAKDGIETFAETWSGIVEPGDRSMREGSHAGLRSKNRLEICYTSLL
jgi:hypothetical protein